jgi:glyoxylase-like metal-dependent hydrolase (beta-lactamase superfamily II)
MSPSVEVKLRLLQAGYCSHFEWLTIRGGSFKPVSFPAGFACIQHPSEGVILFDTGYSSRFFTETATLPASLYRYITPVTYSEDLSAARQLRTLGILPHDVRYVVLSHFHADHIGGVRDFPEARFLYMQASYRAVNQLGPIASVKAGFLPGLLPSNFEERSGFVEDCSVVPLPSEMPFEHGFDLFGDGSLVAVELPGHAAGQIGVFLNGESEAYLLCADAVWSSRAYREGRLPHLAARLIMDNSAHYFETFDRICRLHKAVPQLRIVPSHCQEVIRSMQEEGE